MAEPELSDREHVGEQVPQTRQDRTIDPSNDSQNASSKPNKVRYWDGKFLVATFVIVLLALIAAYLEYSVYPSIISNQFSGTAISLRLSFLTFTVNYERCVAPGSCQLVQGLQAFDFTQLFLILLVLVQVYHFVQRRKTIAHIY